MLSHPPNTSPYLPHENLVEAWRLFFATFESDLAVTLTYNPHVAGSASACRILDEDDRILEVLRPRIDDIDGRHRLPEVRHVPLDRVHQDLDRLHRDVDRRLLGSRYNHSPSEKRSAFIGWIEHASSNIHVHLSWKTAGGRLDETTEVITALWGESHSFGTSRVKLIHDEGGWGRYTVKDQRRDAFLQLDDPALFIASRAVRPGS